MSLEGPQHNNQECTDLLYQIYNSALSYTFKFKTGLTASFRVTISFVSSTSIKMENQLSRANKIYLSVMAILGWFALIGQFYINVNSHAAPLAEIIIRYFSYFTILTNLLVAVCATALLFSPNHKWSIFFSQQQTLTAITVYIVIVGLIYNLILRFLWNPRGLQLVVDELLHSVIPVMFLIYWLVFAAKNKLQGKNILPWLAYPFGYIIYILIRGSFSGFYPYPFINTSQLGLPKVLVNSVSIAVLFIIISLLFVAAGRWINKKHL